jgi:hypothetical protein
VKKYDVRPIIIIFYGTTTLSNLELLKNMLVRNFHLVYMKLGRSALYLHTQHHNMDGVSYHIPNVEYK